MTYPNPLAPNRSENSPQGLGGRFDGRRDGSCIEHESGSSANGVRGVRVTRACNVG
jgi:hypothetical protein